MVSRPMRMFFPVRPHSSLAPFSPRSGCCSYGDCSKAILVTSPSGPRIILLRNGRSNCRPEFPRHKRSRFFSATWLQLRNSSATVWMSPAWPQSRSSFWLRIKPFSKLCSLRETAQGIWAGLKPRRLCISPRRKAFYSNISSQGLCGMALVTS